MFLRRRINAVNLPSFAGSAEEGISFVVGVVGKGEFRQQIQKPSVSRVIMINAFQTSRKHSKVGLKPRISAG